MLISKESEKLKEAIKICLDEIEAVLTILEKRSTSKDTKSKCRGWIKKHKDTLRELNYKGKVARKSRVEKD